MSDYILKVNGVCKDYGSAHVLHDMSFVVPKGSIFGLVGRNGAGKTTIMRIISGLQKPTKGTVEYGFDNKALGKVGALVELPSIYSNASARDNLIYQYINLGLKIDESVDKLLELVGLADTGKKKARNFSLGMRQRLGIGLALCGNPDFLVLDEPINGLDPQGIIEIRELILRLNREKQITVLISSHILDELARLATHFGFIDKGKIVCEMSADELEASSRKCVRLKVTDVKALTKVLDEKKLEYKVISESLCDVYAEPNLTELTLDLVKVNCELLSLENKDESLESFFISLTGGEQDA